MKIIVLLALIVSTLPAMARSVRFTGGADFKIRVFDGNVLREFLEIPVNAVIKYDEYSNIGRQRMVDRAGRTQMSGLGWFRVETIRIREQVSGRTQMKINQLNENSYHRSFYVSQSAVERFSRPVRGSQVYVDTYVPPTQYVPPVEIDVRPTFNAYDVCYVKAYDRYTQLEKKQKREQGAGKIAVGVFGTIAGIALGQSDDQVVSGIGTGIAVGGLFLTGLGMVEMASANDQIFVDSRCRSYYKRDKRVTRFNQRGQTCKTTRYYSRSWRREVQYFETTCSSSRKKYYSFKPHRDYWYY